MTDNLIATGGRANATHFLLHHNPNGLPDVETDEEAIQRKKARITIAQVMVHNRHKFWIKEQALHLWIEQFLPKFSPAIFTPPDQLIKNEEMGSLKEPWSSLPSRSLGPPRLVQLFDPPPLLSDPV